MLSDIVVDIDNSARCLFSIGNQQQRARLQISAPHLNPSARQINLPKARLPLIEEIAGSAKPSQQVLRRSNVENLGLFVSALFSQPDVS